MTDNIESKNMDCRLLPSQEEDQGAETRSSFPKRRLASPAFDINRYTVSQLYQHAQENKAMCLDMEERMFQRIWNDEVDNSTVVEMDHLGGTKGMLQCGQCNTEFEYAGAYNFHMMFKCRNGACKKKKKTLINQSCHICVKVFGPNSIFCYHEHNGMKKPKQLDISSNNQRPSNVPMVCEEIVLLRSTSNAATQTSAVDVSLPDSNESSFHFDHKEAGSHYDDTENTGLEKKSVLKVVRESDKKRKKVEITSGYIFCCDDSHKSPYSRTQTEQWKQPKDTKENLSTDSCNTDKSPVPFNSKPFAVKRETIFNSVIHSRQNQSKEKHRSIQDSKSNYVATDQHDSVIRTENIRDFSPRKDCNIVFICDSSYKTPLGCTQKEDCGIFDI